MCGYISVYGVDDTGLQTKSPEGNGSDDIAMNHLIYN